MTTGVCIACNAQDVEINDEEMCEHCAAEMSGAEEPTTTTTDDNDM